MSKKKKRSRKKRKLKRDNETSIDRIIRISKNRGGRSTMVIKDKTKYDRKRDNSLTDIDNAHEKDI